MFKDKQHTLWKVSSFKSLFMFNNFYFKYRSIAVLVSSRTLDLVSISTSFASKYGLRLTCYVLLWPILYCLLYISGPNFSIPL